MNTKTPVIITLLGLSLVTGLAIAAGTTAAPPAPPAGPMGPPEAGRGPMEEKLGLSDAQRKALADLRARHQAEMQALLTPEQRQKMAAWREHAMPPGFPAGHPGRFHPGKHGGPGGRGAGHGPEMAPKLPANPLEIVAMGERIKDQIAEKLQLTDEQRDKLEHLGRAFRSQQRAAAKKHHEEMRAVLTPEQQREMEQLKRESHRGSRPPGGRPPFVGMNEGPEETAGLPPPEGA